MTDGKYKLRNMLDNLINADSGDNGTKSAQIEFHGYLQQKMQNVLGITTPSTMDMQNANPNDSKSTGKK